LIQEAVDARAEMMKVKVALKRLQDAKANVKHKETMTEAAEMTPDAPIHPEPPQMSSSFPPSPQVLCLFCCF
uniref:Shootin-1 n=1 Tax=Gongylonema pulchrum TaxID=637853 RepID=A0A183DK33_9BILA